MELFYPDIAERLDFSKTKFLDKESFSHLVTGERRIPDFVARVVSKIGRSSQAPAVCDDRLLSAFEP
jgi:hypothetical protein